MLESIDIEVKEGKQIYFASDMHLGSPNAQSSRIRELKLVQWLEEKSTSAAAFFLVGDLFDFWFEYKHVVPKGYVRFLGALAKLADQGIPIYIFSGNHDIWMFDYFPKELGIPVIKGKLVINSNNKKIFVAHGDGLGPNDVKFKLLKKIFTNKFCQWLFSLIHPNFGIGIARLWSEGNKKNYKEEVFHGLDKEWLVLYSKRQLETNHFDFFVYGHRHLPVEVDLSPTSKYFNLGDWITHFSYGVFDGQNFKLENY